MIDTKRASEVVVDLLRGAQLDTIRVYSLILQLGFVYLGRDGNFPDEVWVSASSMLIVQEGNSAVPETSSSRDFFACRASALGDIYRLIGQEVTAASVSDSGVLQIYLGGKCLHAGAGDEINLEEVWTVASDSPEATADHRWCVSLDDSGILSVRVPS